MSKSKDVYCHCLTFSVFFVFCFCFSLLPMYFLCFSLCHSLLYASLHVLNKVFFYFSFLSSARLKYNFKFKNIFFLRKRCFGKFLDLQMKGRIMKSCWVSYLVFIIECIENSSIVSIVNYWYNILDVFSSCKDVLSAMGHGLKCGCNHGDFCCTWTTTSPLQWELVRTKETVFLPTSLIGSFTRYKHSPTSGF